MQPCKSIFDAILVIDYLYKLFELKESKELPDLLFLMYLVILIDGKNSRDTVIEDDNVKFHGCYKFTSKEFDEETGLYYFSARYLDPKASRWMSPDPILNTYLNNINSRNDINQLYFSLYSYCRNNPLKYNDPTGMKDENKVVKFFKDLIFDIGHIGKKIKDKNTEEAIKKLHPKIRDDAKRVILEAQDKKMSLKITSGYRSKEEQDNLYAKGRDENGNVVDRSKIVTNVKGGDSYHNYGLAFDVVEIKDNDAKWDNDNWEKIGEVGKNHGFEWGSVKFFV